MAFCITVGTHGKLYFPISPHSTSSLQATEAEPKSSTQGYGVAKESKSSFENQKLMVYVLQILRVS